MANLLGSLPKELLLVELFPRLGESTHFVLAKVDSFFHSLLANNICIENPLVSFCECSLSLVKWDQEGPARCAVTATAFERAARSARLDVLNYLKPWISVIKQRDRNGLRCAAAIGGSVEVIKFIEFAIDPTDSILFGPTWVDEPLAVALSNRKFEAAKYYLDTPENIGMKLNPSILQIPALFDDAALAERIFGEICKNSYVVIP